MRYFTISLNYVAESCTRWMTVRYCKFLVPFSGLISDLLFVFLVFFLSNSQIGGQGRFIFYVFRSRHNGRTPLDEGSDRRRDLYLTIQPSKEKDIITPAGFEHRIPAINWRQNVALDQSATGIDHLFV